MRQLRFGLPHQRGIILGLRLEISARMRHRCAYLLRTCAAFGAIVVMSWLALLVERRVFGEVIIALIGIGSLIYFYLIYPELPPVSDNVVLIWLLACLAFVFAEAFCIFLFALVAHCVTQWTANEPREQIFEESAPHTPNENGAVTDAAAKAALLARVQRCKRRCAKCTDTILRLLFPVTFIVFGTIFWLNALYLSE